ncbi:TIGR03667 family PPOX class F420-dependent oxidoreductase [Streptosporangium fragile]|uniref:TIGR03667 family PPOX class F420-dependent oxidoreductase n=1 Tax=Streptosporangium fragile TaxID=46186 RepID=A0ABN3W9B6_9ACTN
MTVTLPDAATEFGARVRHRLTEERVVWLTTVTDGGIPCPNPVWFWWDGESFLIYNWDRARRPANLRARPRVSLHFDGGPHGRDVVVFTGEARLLDDPVPAHLVPGYLAKYREAMIRLEGSPEAFGRTHPTALLVRPTGIRGR